MKRPMARPMPPQHDGPGAARGPRAFAAAAATGAAERVESLSDAEPDPGLVAPARRRGRLGRIAWTAGGLLVSLGLGLAAERLIRNFFASGPWLGWLGLAVLAAFVVAVVILALREVLALRRLRVLDRLRLEAAAVLEHDRQREARLVLARLEAVDAARPDLGRARAALATEARDLLDGGDQVRLAERHLMAPLDARARALTAASARRVALVTTVSPRALIDIAFVIFESVRLGGDIARLYGARPGVFGTWRLLGAILAHLAVTGGLVLTDGVVEQLVGQGLAAKLSARLGEGLVNGLMTVRVGIAAMRVVRPLPFAVLRQPMVKDFIPELAKVHETAQRQ